MGCIGAAHLAKRQMELRARSSFIGSEALLFQEYEVRPASREKNITIGLPRTLEFWDSMPFWTTFFRALGFRMKLARPSSRAMAERRRQILDYMEKADQLPVRELEDALDQGMAALRTFHDRLREEGGWVLETVRRSGRFAVLLAGRPYHNDPLVSHGLSRAFTREGVTVLTLDSLPELYDTNLRYTVAEITNHFHARMLAGAAE